MRAGELIRGAALALAVTVAGGTFVGCDDEEPKTPDAAVTDGPKDTAVDSPAVEAGSDVRLPDGGVDSGTGDSAPRDGGGSDAPAVDSAPAEAGSDASDATPADTGGSDATDATPVDA
jgi:hypothetical protein